MIKLEKGREAMTNPVRNEDAVVVKFTETVSTLALLNLYWVISAVLIIPIFAGIEALFYCVNRHVETRETGFGRLYFNYVKDNMAPAFRRQWLPMSVLLVTVFDAVIIYFLPINSVMRSLFLGVFIVLSLLVYFLFMYQLTFLFATGHQTESMKARVGKAFYTIIRFPQYSLSLTLIFLLYFLISLYFVPMLFFFGLSFPAYCFTVVILNKVKQKSHRMD